MCGRFQLDVSLETLEEMFESLQVPERQIFQTGELTPGREIAMIGRQDSEYGLRNAVWGRKHDKTMQINARSERWMKTYKSYQRCVIPATGYFEWNQHTKAKVLFETKSHPVFFLAGVYALNERGGREALILTRNAEVELASIHSRMPVVFDLENSKRFLENAVDQVEQWITIRQWRTRLCSSEQMRLFE